MGDFLNAALTNLWWPFVAGAVMGAVCFGISALARRWRQR